MENEILKIAEMVHDCAIEKVWWEALLKPLKPLKLLSNTKWFKPFEALKTPLK